MAKGYGEVTAEEAAWSYNTRIQLKGRGGANSYIAYAEARDKQTVVLKLRAPFSGFILALCSGFHLRVRKLPLERVRKSDGPASRPLSARPGHRPVSV